MRVQSSVRNAAGTVRIRLWIYPSFDPHESKLISLDLPLTEVIALRDALDGIVTTLLEHPVKA